jgi:hypothetical protein
VKTIGKGILSWTRYERIGDRHGIVFLMQDGQTSETPERNGVRLKYHNLHGSKGKLIAKVIGQRNSKHIGDLFRGLFSETPELHEMIELGEGELFFEEFKGSSAIYDCVGLKPDDGRESDWLDPEKLYRAHEQLVELYFQPQP